MDTCPRCHQNQQQIKIGFTRSGSQRYRCRHCGQRCTPEPKAQGYPEALRQQAVQFCVDGINFRRIARHLGVHHQTVINRIDAYEATLPNSPPLPTDDIGVIEQDELFTFVAQKKTKSTS